MKEPIAVTATQPPVGGDHPRHGAPEALEPWTGRALWPTFMRRTLPMDDGPERKRQPVPDAEAQGSA
jgi:hypothetical protein